MNWGFWLDDHQRVRPADLAGRDQVPEVAERRAVAEAEPHLGHDPGCLRPAREIGRLLDGAGERLLAEDWQPRVQRGGGDRVMNVVGGHERDRIDAGGQQLPVIGKGPGDPEVPGQLLGPVMIGVADGGDLDVRGVREGRQVSASRPEPGAHDADPQRHRLRRLGPERGHDLAAGRRPYAGRRRDVGQHRLERVDPVGLADEPRVEGEAEHAAAAERPASRMEPVEAARTGRSTPPPSGGAPTSRSCRPARGDGSA